MVLEHWLLEALLSLPQVATEAQPAPRMGAAWALAVRRGTFRPSRPPAPGPTAVGALASWGGEESWSTGRSPEYFATLSLQANSTATYFDLLKNDTTQYAHKLLQRFWTRNIALGSDWRAFPRHHQWTKSFAKGQSGFHTVSGMLDCVD